MSSEDNSHRTAVSAALEADRRMRLRLGLTVTVIGVVALSVAVWGWLGDNTDNAAVNPSISAHDEPIKVPASTPQKAEVTGTHGPSEEYAAAIAKAESAKRMQAVVLERHAENLGGAVLRYWVKVKVTVPTYSSTFLITCTYDENNIGAGDCGQWPLPDHFDWSTHTCEWEIYDPLTGKSEHETCVLGLGMSGYMQAGSWIVKSLDNEPNHPVVTSEGAPQAFYDAGGCSALDDTGESRICGALFHIDQPDGSAQRLTLTCFEGSDNSRFAGRTCSWPLPKSFNPIYVNDARGCEHRDARGKDDVEILGCLPFEGSTYIVSKP